MTVELKNIDLSLGGKSIFRGFDLSVGEGENMLLYGKSGTGKTSLLRLIMGFAIPESGEVLLNGTPIDQNLYSVRQNIAYVPQDMDIAGGRLRDFVHYVFSLKANSRLYSDPVKIFIQIAPELDLPADILDKDMSEVSGGEKQRAAIVIAEMLRRPLMLLDEPTASLDKELKERVAARIVNNNATTIIVSHDEIWLGLNGIRRVDMEPLQ